MTLCSEKKSIFENLDFLINALRTNPKIFQECSIVHSTVLPSKCLNKDVFSSYMSFMLTKKL